MIGDYKVDGKLGEGGFGSVYKSVNQSNGETFALKLVDLRKLKLQTDPRAL